MLRIYLRVLAANPLNYLALASILGRREPHRLANPDGSREGMYLRLALLLRG